MKDSIMIDDTRGKIIFWDIDGTLAPYRWNGRISDIEHYGEEICPAIEEGLYLKREPSKHMQHVLSTCEAKSHCVLGHYIYDKEKSDKVVWLHKHFSQIDNTIFVPLNSSKADALIEFCSVHNINIDDVIFVDDRVEILKDAEEKGIKCWHISSFLDWFESDN